MESTDLFVFLSAYAIFTFALVAFDSAHRRAWLPLLGLAAALAALAGTAVLGILMEPGSNSFDVLLRIAQEQRPRHMVAATMGAAAALAWAGRLWTSIPRRASGSGAESSGEAGNRAALASQLLDQLVVGASIVGVVGSGGLLLWNSIFDLKIQSKVRMFAPGFVVDEIAEIPFLPVNVVVDGSGDLYVSYFWTENNATHGGGIIKLTRDPKTGSFTQKTVARSDFLFRTLGLAEKDGDLYVSRSGYHGVANAGTLSYADTGAVTQLKDLDDDGYFEYYDDILSGLPGGRGPDIQHQNNGIAFAPDGSLYVTNAFASQDLDEHHWGGAILKLSADFEKVEVFARGFRNPFAILVTPDGEVFLTDNDVEENPGDELDHLIAGEHYGHPFVIPNQAGVQPVGFREPILLGSLTANFVGFAYAGSPALPEEFRDCFYIADLSGDEVLRVRFEPDGSTFKVTQVDRFARIPTPLDIAVSQDGDIYVLSRFDQKIFRIRHLDSVASQGKAP